MSNEELRAAMSAEFLRRETEYLELQRSDILRLISLGACHAAPCAVTVACDTGVVGSGGGGGLSTSARSDVFVTTTGSSIAQAVVVYPPDAARKEGAGAERARILALIEAQRPTETQYTRREWRWEEKGAQAMFEKILRAISEPVKGGE